MALVPLSLYVSPNDVYDYVGTEGADLRLDDHNDATGQRIRVTADAAPLAVSLAVAALSQPLLKGTVLQFDGGGMPAVSPVALTATATTGATTLAVAPLTDAVYALATALDSGVNLATAQRLVKACQYGTSQVKLYLCSRYDDSALAQCWSVNRFAAVAGGKWLCTRRAQACPQSIKDDWDEVLEQMRQIRTGMLDLEDVGTRTSGWPFITNVTVDIGYYVAKVRVEQSISEATPTQYGQRIDFNSVFWLEV